MLKLFRSIRPLTRSNVFRNAFAGVTLAAMNIPQALGYTKIAGMPVITGLYTLLLPLIAFAGFCSSRFLVVAADSATAAILAGGLIHLATAESAHYVALAGAVALLTAGFLILARIFGLGFIADFLSRTVLVGFLTGVGFQVGIAMLGQMLGLDIQSHKTLQQLVELARNLPHIHLWTVYISCAVVVMILLFRRFAPRIPVPLFVVIGAIVMSYALNFSGHGVTVVGPVSGGLPQIRFPLVTFREWMTIFPVSFSCFIMIITQSAATARAYASRHHQSLDENADLTGLSAANAAAAFSGTFVVNGSPTQTAMVERSGGSSQLAQLSTAIVVGLVLLFLTEPLQYLPRCVLGSIVFIIAIGLLDFRGLDDIRKESFGEFHLAVGTAAVVVAVGVEQGILLAMGVSLLRHVHHSYKAHTAILVESENGQWRSTKASPGSESAPGIIVFQFGADLFYANAAHFTEKVQLLIKGAPTKVMWLIVDAGAITSIDYSASRAFQELLEELKANGVTLIMVHVPESLKKDLHRHRLVSAIGVDHMYDTLREALAMIHGK